ncbi:hypothetical protein [Candidatus Cardinium hertigii]|uniref:Uncharacterized protein n=1 Tax=Candidatus Cardinium hertigii TaxID=247481 RepID=A0A2Z3LEW3_9BACT|nr:hypothetical protein [Candidatus Cardinium hertigii]AWN82226.1 hypothetical protein DK880_00928 [Candidatus Cardinium hertigii]
MPLHLQKNTAPLLFLSSILMLIGSCGRGPTTSINNRINYSALKSVSKSEATTISTVSASNQQQHYAYGFELLQHFQPQQQHFQPQQQHFQPQQQHFQPQQQHFQPQQQHFQPQQQHFQPQQQHFQPQQQHFQPQQQHFQPQQQYFQPQQQHWNQLQYLEIVKRRAEEAKKEAYEELILLEQTKIHFRVYAISLAKEVYNREQKAKRKAVTAIKSEKIAEQLQEQLKQKA